MTIRLATLEDIHPLADLFDQYRIFYGQTTDKIKAEAFLEERLSHAESVVAVAILDNQFAGFIQLYPSFSSVGMNKIWILNDLFIAPAFRRTGIGTALLLFTIDYARKTNRKKVELATALDNHQAQELYEALGFQRTGFYLYEYMVD